MGSFKKTIRSWREDIARVWGALRTFHRVALAITIAMVMIYFSRVKILDPLNGEVTAELQKLDSDGVPLIVPEISEEPDIQELQYTLESLQGSSARWKTDMEKTLAGRPQIFSYNRGDALSAFETLITDAGMAIVNRVIPNDGDHNGGDNSRDFSGKDKSTKDSSKPTPLSVLKYNYRLEGPFDSLQECLRHISTFAYPARVAAVEISMISDSDGGVPVIELCFMLELYYHEQ